MPSRLTGGAGIVSLMLAACGGDDAAAVSATHEAGPEGTDAPAVPETDAVSSGADADGSTVIVSDGGDASSVDGSPPLGAPIAAPDRQWTWIDFPDSSCDDGTPTGIGIRPSAGSDKLLVYFMGGGACWDYLTCAQLNTSVHGPFGAAQFAALAAGRFTGTILDDALLGNPYKGASLVFVPYCTGDLHAGDVVTMYAGLGGNKAIAHKGHANALAFLARIAATFKSPAQVVVSGSSAGGGGALFNYPSFRAYWPTQPMQLVDDSLPLLVGDKIAMRAQWFTSWDLAKVTDPVCGAPCKNDLSLFMSAIAKSYPKDRMALLSSLQDSTIRGYYLLTPADFEASQQALTAGVLDPVGNFKHFYVSGPSHTMLATPTTFTSHGVTLLSWLTQMATGDAAWASVDP